MKLASLLTGTFLSIGLLAGSASAQDYPSKPVNYIIPFSAGGESDIAARFQQPVFEQITGQPMVIQYLEGAGGAQAWSQLNEMGGDGYTVMGTNLPHIILQPMAQEVGYQTDDIVNVYFFQYTPDAIVVPADSQFETLEDLVSYAKENPGLVTFSGSGTYSANEVAKTKFDNLADVTTTYVPFSGTTPAITAVLGDQVQAGLVTPPQRSTRAMRSASLPWRPKNASRASPMFRRSRSSAMTWWAAPIAASAYPAPRRKTSVRSCRTFLVK